MPAPLNVNREAVRTLAVAIGVRAAARELGLDEDTVRQWSSRGKWFAPTVKPPTVVSPVTTVTKSPADVLSRLGEATKFHLATAGAKASKRLAGMKGAEIVRASSDFKNIVGGSAQLHGWDTRFQGTQFSLNVLNVGSFGIDINQ